MVASKHDHISIQCVLHLFFKYALSCIFLYAFFIIIYVIFMYLLAVLYYITLYMGRKCLQVFLSSLYLFLCF